MKKSLSKVLARMAKDGDTETVAGIIEEMIAENAEEAAAEEPVTVEVPENHEITIDEETLSGLLQRLDQLIFLLTTGLAPAEPAAEDEEPEEVAEAVEEILEAAAEAEAPDPAEEIAEIVEAVLEPETSVTLEEGSGDDCDGPDPAEAKDTLRAVLTTFRPVLKRMSSGERRKACADIVARMRRTRKAGGSTCQSSSTEACRAACPAACGTPRNLRRSLGNAGSRGTETAIRHRALHRYRNGAEPFCILAVRRLFLMMKP